MLKVYACIWSNDQAAEMAKFYQSIFKGTRIGKTSYWPSNPMGVREGSVGCQTGLDWTSRGDSRRIDPHSEVRRMVGSPAGRAPPYLRRKLTSHPDGYEVLTPNSTTIASLPRLRSGRAIRLLNLVRLRTRACQCFRRAGCGIAGHGGMGVRRARNRYSSYALT